MHSTPSHESFGSARPALTRPPIGKRIGRNQRPLTRISVQTAGNGAKATAFSGTRILERRAEKLAGRGEPDRRAAGVPKDAPLWPAPRASAQGKIVELALTGVSLSDRSRLPTFTRRRHSTRAWPMMTDSPGRQLGGGRGPIRARGFPLPSGEKSALSLVAWSRRYPVIDAPCDGVILGWGLRRVTGGVVAASSGVLVHD